tara:strand:+ start:80 stop:556 length:477 start_codon:yes stop_codon:yes gene_type:complete
MNVDKYINIIDNINLIVEKLSKSDVESNIKTTSDNIDRLSNRIQRHKNKKVSPYNEIIIDFYGEVTLSVRSADEKKENIFKGRQYFDVVGFSDNYFILQKSDWDSTIALKLTYSKLTERITQKGDISLFYNRNGDVSNGRANRSSVKEEITYEIIRLK